MPQPTNRRGAPSENGGTERHTRRHQICRSRMRRLSTSQVQMLWKDARLVDPISKVHLYLPDALTDCTRRL